MRHSTTLQTSEQRRCAGQGSGGEYSRSSCQPCVCSHGTKPPRSQPCCCKRGGRAEQVREGLSPEEAELLLWGLSDRLWSVAMHMFFFSVLKSHWESIITPLRPCNFMAFFIMAIIYNNLAVMLASSLASVVSDSPSKMMEVKLDHSIRAKSSFLLSFLLPKWWLCQWDSSGLFFPCTHPQRHTVKIQILDRAASSMQQRAWKMVSCSFFPFFMRSWFPYSIKTSDSCMAAICCLATGPGQCSWRWQYNTWRALRQEESLKDFYKSGTHSGSQK